VNIADKKRRDFIIKNSIDKHESKEERGKIS
jgi:hypothetical protein